MAELGNFVQSRHDGNLVCSMHDSFWCPHIQHIVQDGLDTQSLFEEAVTAISQDPDIWETGINDIWVPIVPTKGIFVLVFLKPALDRDSNWIGSFDANLQVTEGDIHKGGPRFKVYSSPPYRLGLLNRGEGRLILKQMVMNWFYPEIEEHNKKSCLSRHHNFSSDLKLNERLVSGKFSERFLNAWSKTFLGKCIICFEIDPSPNETWDVDDYLY